MKKEELHSFIMNLQPNICQIVGHKNGKMVYSDTWNSCAETDSWHVMSVTKSVVSILVGICIDKGLIKSIDDRVLDYFPEYKVKRGEKTIWEVTIKHLLTMTAPYKYRYEPWTKICSSDDWTVAALNFLGGRKGITNEFKYSTLGIHILSGIVSKVSGMNTVDFANEYLFEPIGVKAHINYLAETAEEHKEFTISKAPKENVWFCDPQGIGCAGYGLCFSALDMAKIGQLCLDNGHFNGKQIVSSKWIEESTKGTIICDENLRNISYGYLWWVIDEGKGIYSAIGNSGNVIYVNPSKNIVISVTGYFKPAIVDRIDFIQEYIEPFIDKEEI